MLMIQGGRQRQCDGLGRRDFLAIGGLSFGAAGFSLGGLLRAEAATPGTRPGHKALINVFLGGGPPHQDLFDLKPDAPSEVRGEFKPIATNVSGIQISEVFPRLATRMDKCAIIRSVVGCDGDHSSFQTNTGWNPASLRTLGGRPSIGAAVAKLHGPVDKAVPPFVGLAAKTAHGPWSDSGTAGFLGPSHGPFKPDGPDMANMQLKDLSLDRLSDRQRLLASVDRLRRDVDSSGTLAGMD
ncbi:MAG: DUF1501 domain-containing protein, partial [Planctomycetaceae bacterium]